jgi:S1 RNA binding domain protein
MGEGKQAVPCAVGEVVKGVVEHIAPYGAFVRLENGQKAMIHISELSYDFVKKVEDVLSMSQEVAAKVIKIDDKGRIDLSLKALTPREPKPVMRREREEDFEKKLTSFMKRSDEKIADLNSKEKDARGGSKKRQPKK